MINEAELAREATLCSLTDPRTGAAKWRELARLAMARAAECDEQYQQRIVLTVPGDIVRDLSPNQRLNWRARMSRNRCWRQKGQEAWKAAGSPRFKPPVSVQITVRRGRTVDSDNAVSACKAIRDSLWGPDAMLPSDSAQHLANYNVQLQTGGRWALFPEVELCITGEPLLPPERGTHDSG